MRLILQPYEAVRRIQVLTETCPGFTGSIGARRAGKMRVRITGGRGLRRAPPIDQNHRICSPEHLGDIVHGCKRERKC